MTLKDAGYIFIAGCLGSSSMIWLMGWPDSFPTTVLAGLGTVAVFKLSELLFS